MFDSFQELLVPPLPWGIGLRKSAKSKEAEKSVSILLDPWCLKHFQTCSTLKWKIAPVCTFEADLSSEGCSFDAKEQEKRQNNLKLELSALDGDARIEALSSSGPSLNGLFDRRALENIQFSYLFRLSSNSKLTLEACSTDRLIRIGAVRDFFALPRLSLRCASQISFSEAKRNGTVNFSFFLSHSHWFRAGMKINPIFGHYDFYQSLGKQGEFVAHLYLNPFSLESECVGSLRVPWVRNGTGRISIGSSSLATSTADWLSVGAWLDKAVVLVSDDNPISLSLGFSVSGSLSKVKFGVLIDC
jgi:hypothetical protein